MDLEYQKMSLMLSVVAFEVLHVLQGSLIAGPMVLMAEAPRILMAADGVINGLFDAIEGAGAEENVDGLGILPGTNWRRTK